MIDINNCCSSPEVISELRGVTCHTGSHSVTCHPTQVNAPSQTGPYTIMPLVNLAQRVGRPSWPRWLGTSKMSAVIHPSSNWAGVERLCWLKPIHYHAKKSNKWYDICLYALLHMHLLTYKLSYCTDLVCSDFKNMFSRPQLKNSVHSWRTILLI